MTLLTAIPAFETLGYFRVSLRDKTRKSQRWSPLVAAAQKNEYPSNVGLGVGAIQFFNFGSASRANKGLHHQLHHPERGQDCVAEVIAAACVGRIVVEHDLTASQA